MPRGSSKQSESRRNLAPPQTPEEQEQQLISLAMNQAREMLLTGNAPTGVVMHFLRLATEKERAQTRKLNADAEMAVAKSDYVRMQQKHEQDYQEVVTAFKGYGGNTGVLNSSEKEEIDNPDYDLGMRPNFADSWFAPPH